MPVLKINETFASIQGEGEMVGTPMLFIRFTGCNRRCRFCDTKRSWKHGKEYLVEEVASIARSSGYPYICITGGEPTLQMDGLLELAKELAKANKRIHVETNGTLFSHTLASLAEVTVSPKGEYDILWDTHAFQFKYVIRNARDLMELEQIRYARQYLQPVDNDRKVFGMIREFCLSHPHFKAGYQLHKIGGFE